MCVRKVSALATSSRTSEVSRQATVLPTVGHIVRWKASTVLHRYYVPTLRACSLAPLGC